MTQIWASDPQFNDIAALFVHENCVLLGYNAASRVISYRRFGTVCRSHLQGSLVFIFIPLIRMTKGELSFCSLKYCFSYFCHDFPLLLFFQYFLRLSLFFFFSLPVFKCLSQTGCVAFWTNNVERTSLNNVSLLFRATNRSVSWFFTGTHQHRFLLTRLTVTGSPTSRPLSSGLPVSQLLDLLQSQATLRIPASSYDIKFTVIYMKLYCLLNKMVGA